MKVLVTLISFFIFSCTTSSIERPSAGRLKSTVWDKGAMVSAANPHAVDAAVEIIKKVVALLTQPSQPMQFLVSLSLKALV